MGYYPEYKLKGLPYLPGHVLFVSATDVRGPGEGLAKAITW